MMPMGKRDKRGRGDDISDEMGSIRRKQSRSKRDKRRIEVVLQLDPGRESSLAFDNAIPCN